ncbi:hypothetical protein ACQ4LE_001161 [Meloidogyne hapla]|uniref:Syntaxin-6_N domain-containing protein n=1 Tax=Meloidogyne hapla TaxID=6305 RepID=A0A1I8BBR0_MELHA
MKSKEQVNSDFAAEFFTSDESKNWYNLLTRLRSFEETVCKTVRRLETKIADGQTAKTESSSSSQNLDFEEKFEVLEEQFKSIETFVKDGMQISSV